ALTRVNAAVIAASASQEWWLYGILAYLAFYNIHQIKLKALFVAMCGRPGMAVLMLLLPDWAVG
nr:protein p7 [Hepacivirus macronycteridis]